MLKAYSYDFRKRVMKFLEEGNTIKGASPLFKISRNNNRMEEIIKSNW